LAVLDLSVQGEQPMCSESGRYVIVCNGEIYNFRELRKELTAAGTGFRGTSDTEVMLAAIEHWGLDRAVKRFNGMFAFALWDRQQRFLHLVRDRFGEKPLYYGLLRGTFLFGSELKAMRAHPHFNPAIDRQALTLYMRYGNVPAPHSIYLHVYKQPPATILTLNATTMRWETETYWSLTRVIERGQACPFRGSLSEAAEELEALLIDAVRLRMVADVPIGAFLSGGVDSSLIVALMQASTVKSVPTFTIGFREPSYDEAHHAATVAHRLGTNHTEMCVTPEDALSIIPFLPDVYDEPFADSSQIPTLLLSRLARQVVTVCVSGDGGDELFGGYNRHVWVGSIWSKGRRLPSAVRKLGIAATGSVSSPGWEAALTSVERLLPKHLRVQAPSDKLRKLASALSLEGADQIYFDLLAHWKQPASVVLQGHETEPATPTDGEPGWDVAQRMMYLDATTYLPNDILVKLDRASMAVSLETRAPYLDHRIAEFAWRLPLAMKIRGLDAKRILRQVLYKYVPAETVRRPKAGFVPPIGAWLRGPLREWAEDLIVEERLRDESYLEPRIIRTTWSQHVSGARDHEQPLWCVLMFQAWLTSTKNGSGLRDCASVRIS
jgi:asparagine synthase (glutamine-hydrolysing)